MVMEAAVPGVVPTLLWAGGAGQGPRAAPGPAEPPQPPANLRKAAGTAQALAGPGTQGSQG